ncbi:MAG: T9SS type A sorting domain-containing protein [Bacteroidota bacterium]
MKIHYFILIFCLTFLSFSSQSQISFFKTYSDNGYDKGEGIVQLQDSSYLVTGSSSSFTESSQAFIMKVDSLGNRLWSNHYGGTETEKGRRIFHVPGDGIYVVGQTNSYPNKFFDAYFFKTDLSGGLLFEKNYGGNEFEDIHDAVMLKDTSFILVGETQSTTNEIENLFILRINKFGDTLWTKNFGSEGKDVARSIKMLNDTTCIIAGEYYVSDSLTQKALVLRMHINGTQEWLKTYGDLGKYVLNDLILDNGEIKTVGYNQENLAIEGNNKQCMMKMDSDGNLIYIYSEEHIGDFSFEHIVKFSSALDDYYYVSKVLNSPDIPTYNDGYDAVIYKFDNSMVYNFIFMKPAFTGTGNDMPNEIIPCSDGGAILVGYNELNGTNVFLAKIAANNYFPFNDMLPDISNLVSVKEEEKSKFKIFPNPVEKEIILVNYPFKSTRISIQNQLGVEILALGNFQEKINIESLNSGMYFLVLENEKSKEIIKFIKN